MEPIGRRTFYVISSVFDYDGYTPEFHCISTNRREAIKRFDFIVEALKIKYEMETTHEDWYQSGDLRNRDNPKEPLFGEVYMNDGNSYLTIYLEEVRTNNFNNNQGYEERFREENN